MKLISNKLVNNCTMKFEAVFDTDLMGSVTKEGDDVYTADYDMSEGGTIIDNAFPTKSALFVIKLTRNNVFASLIVTPDEESFDVDSLSEFMVDDMIDFNVKLTDEEKVKLLLKMIMQK